MAFTPFPSRIRIGYVLKVDGGYSYLFREEVEKAGLTVQQLHELAIHNLEKEPIPSFRVGKTPGGAEAFLEEAADNFTAARILLPVVRKALSAQLGSEYYAAIPCRDWFVCWSKEQALEWQEKNKEGALKIFREDSHNLSPDIFVISGARVALHIEQEA